MAQVEVGGQRFTVRAIAFDKDGTLVDIHHLWGERTLLWIENIVTLAGGDAELFDELCQSVGVLPRSARLVAEGPSAVATSLAVGTLAAGTLCRTGRPWHEAVGVVQSAAQGTILAPLSGGDVRTLGDVVGTIRRLSEAGILPAVVTGDDRATTEAILRFLDIDRHVGVTLCGDDPLPGKPDGAALEWVGRQLGVVPAEMLMVGDTATDMLAGRNAGVAGCIGIGCGAGDPKLLAQLADVVVDSIEEIVLVEPE